MSSRVDEVRSLELQVQAAMAEAEIAKALAEHSEREARAMADRARVLRSPGVWVSVLAPLVIAAGLLVVLVILESDVSETVQLALAAGAGAIGLMTAVAPVLSVTRMLRAGVSETSRLVEAVRARAALPATEAGGDSAHVSGSAG